MSFKLPPAGHKSREMMGDMASLAVILDPVNAMKLPSTNEACRRATETLARDTGATRVFSVIIRGDDERWLISVGPRGGWVKEWNFGKGL